MAVGAKNKIYLSIIFIILIMSLIYFSWSFKGPYKHKKVALAFSRERKGASDLNLGDVKLINYLRKKGLHVSKEIWDDKNVDWSKYDIVLLYQTWSSITSDSYLGRLPQYISWIKSLEQKGIQVQNNSHIVEDFIDKSVYMAKLKEKQINIIPTIFLHKNTNFSIKEVANQNKWTDVVVKTGISELANNIYRVIIDSNEYLNKKANYLAVKNIDNEQSVILHVDEFSQIFKDLLQNHNVLVQKYMPEIKTNGEVSCTFVLNNITHCVRKFTGASDEEFRTQRIFSKAIPNFVELNQKDRQAYYLVYNAAFLNYGEKAPLVARIDMILDQSTGGQWLMEIEAIDPWMYLNELLAKSETSANFTFEQYFQAIIKKLSQY